MGEIHSGGIEMKIDLSFFKYLPTWLKTTMVLAVVFIGVVVFFVYARVTNTDETLCLSCHPVRSCKS